MITLIIAISQIFLPVFIDTRGPQRGVAVVDYRGTWRYDAPLLNTDWGYSYTPAVAPGIVPMLRSHTFSSGLEYLIDTGYTGYIMFLNEPEIDGQDNIAPDQAADLYALLVGQSDAEVIGPGVWWNGPGNGRQWLIDWHSEIGERGLEPPAGYAIHHYEFVAPNNPWDSVNALRDQLAAWGENGAEIWLTEFTICGGPDELHQAIVHLDSMQSLARYAYFATRHYGDEWPTCRYELIDDSGLITDNGLVFARPFGPFR